MAETFNPARIVVTAHPRIPDGLKVAGAISEYLKTQGITDREIFSDFKVGFGNGTLLNAVPGEGEVWEALKEIGILNTEGQEVFYGCVVFPIFDENHDCVDHYGRKIM